MRHAAAAAAGVLAAWAAWRAWQQVRFFLRRDKVLRALPHNPQGFWGQLDLLADRDHMHHNFARLCDELGGLCYVRILWKQLVVVTDPSLCQQLLSHRADLPKEPGTYRSFNTLTSPAGRTPNMLGSVHSKGYWRLVRKGVAPAFSPRNIRAEFGHVLQLADQLSGILSAAGPGSWVDMDNLLQRESMDVIGRIGFQTDFGALSRYSPGSGTKPSGSPCSGTGEAAAVGLGDIFELTKGAALEIAKRWSQPLRTQLWWLLPDARRGEACLRGAQARMRALLREVQARGPPSGSDTSIAAHLLRIRDPATGHGLTEEQLAGEIALFFFAGYETSGHTAAWALYFLASHPEVAARVDAELDALGLLATPAQPHPRPLEYSDLGKLRYLSQVIKESQRLVPVVAGGTARLADRDLTLRHYAVPAGTMLIVGGIGLHLSKHNWEEPERFLPERWDAPGAEYWLGDLRPPTGQPLTTTVSPAAAAAVRDSSSGGEAREGVAEDEVETEAGSLPLRFAPFSQGPRSCIGQHLARMNYTATLAVLLSRFTFQLPPELLGPGALWDLQCNLMTNQPKGGLPMQCTPRMPSDV